MRRKLMHSPALEQKREREGEREWERERKKGREGESRNWQINENQQHLLPIGNDVPCPEVLGSVCVLLQWGAQRCETHLNGGNGEKQGLLCLQEAGKCILKKVGDQLMNKHKGGEEQHCLLQAQEPLGHKVLVKSWLVLHVVIISLTPSITGTQFHHRKPGTTVYHLASG